MAQSKGAHNVVKLDNQVVSLYDFMTGAEQADARALTHGLDMASAINAAFAESKISLKIPPGGYLVGSNLNAPLCSEIIGSGILNTRLKAAAGVTKVLKLNSTAANLFLLRDFAIDGNSTAAAVGLSLGDGSSLVSQITVENLAALSFTGAGARGIDFDYIVNSKFYNLYTAANAINMRFFDSSGAGSAPQEITLFGCNCLNAADIGISYLAGKSNAFIAQSILASAHEGFKMVTGAGVAADVAFMNSHLEQNWGATTTEYQVVVDSTAGGGTCRFNWMFGRVLNGVGTAKPFRFAGGTLVCRVSQPHLASIANAIKVESAVGYIDLQNDVAGDYASMVQDATRTMSDLTLDGNSWKAWTPTASSDLGNQAATFAAYTLSIARYKREGKTLHAICNWLGTTVAGTPAYIDFTLPTGMTAKNTDKFSTYSSQGGVEETGILRVSGASVRFYRAASAVWPAGTAIVGQVTFQCELDAIG